MDIVLSRKNINERFIVLLLSFRNWNIKKIKKEGKMRTEVFTKEQYKEFTKELIRSFEKRKIVPLNTLKNDHYILKNPLYITLEIEDGVVIASLDDIEAFAYADTEYEAINQLSEEIVNLYKDLKDDRENLGPLPQKWLAFLEEVIRER